MTTTPTSPAEKMAEELVETFMPYAHGLYEAQSRKNAIGCAIVLCNSHIEELNQLRKPEYTTFILRYIEWIDNDPNKGESHPGETMDGYEKQDFWQEVKQILEKQLK